MIDVFAPPREDFLLGGKPAYMRAGENGSKAVAKGGGNAGHPSQYQELRPRGGVVTQRSAKPCTPVQFRTWPPTSTCNINWLPKGEPHSLQARSPSGVSHGVSKGSPLAAPGPQGPQTASPGAANGICGSRTGPAGLEGGSRGSVLPYGCRPVGCCHESSGVFGTCGCLSRCTPAARRMKQ